MWTKENEKEKKKEKEKRKRKRKSFTTKAKFDVFFLNNKQVRKKDIMQLRGGYQNIFISRYQGIIISYHILSTTNQPTNPSYPQPLSPSSIAKEKTTNLFLKKLIRNSSPSGPRGTLRLESLESLIIEFTTTGIDIDFRNFSPTFALPEPSDGVEENDDEEGEVGLEEGFGSCATSCVDGVGDGDVGLLGVLVLVFFFLLLYRGDEVVEGFWRKKSLPERSRRE